MPFILCVKVLRGGVLGSDYGLCGSRLDEVCSRWSGELCPQHRAMNLLREVAQEAEAEQSAQQLEKEVGVFFTRDKEKYPRKFTRGKEKYQTQGIGYRKHKMHRCRMAVYRSEGVP